MNVPQLPNFDKKAFPDVPWLARFYDLLRPWLEGVSSLLESAPAWVKVAENVIGTATPASAGDLATDLFIPTEHLPALVVVRAETVDANRRSTGRFLTSTVTWMPGSKGGAPGITLLRLHTVNTLGGTPLDVRLTVWVLPG